MSQTLESTPACRRASRLRPFVSRPSWPSAGLPVRPKLAAESMARGRAVALRANPEAAWVTRPCAQ